MRSVVLDVCILEPSNPLVHIILILPLIEFACGTNALLHVLSSGPAMVIKKRLCLLDRAVLGDRQHYIPRSALGFATSVIQ